MEFSDFFKKYIDLVEVPDPVCEMTRLRNWTIQLLSEIPIKKWDYRYEEGKWTIKEIMIHIIDTERIMSARALRIARGETQNLPGFNQDEYTQECHCSHRSAISVLNEYKAVRNACICLFRNLAEEDLDRVGLMSQEAASPRAIAYIIAGHEKHHLQVIKERYL